MAWPRPGDKPLSELMMVSLLAHICLTWPQWVNTWIVLRFKEIFSTIFEWRHLVFVFQCPLQARKSLQFPDAPTSAALHNTGTSHDHRLILSRCTQGTRHLLQGIPGVFISEDFSCKLWKERKMELIIKRKLKKSIFFQGIVRCHDRLTHWGWDKIAAASQKMFSNTFSWVKMYEFWLKFHWSLFPGVQLTIFHHWFR